MKKFISVLLAILMVVAVMPFAIFAAEEAEEESYIHPCYPVDDKGNYVFDSVNMADATVAFKKAATDTQVVEKFLTDGKKDTATRLPVGTTATLTITFAEAKDLATLTLTVNGKGKINPGEEFQAEVVADSAHNLKVKVVAYKGTTKVYEDTAAVDTTELKDLVVDIYGTVDKIEITTAGAANATKGGPRLWEISATQLKGEDAFVHDYEQVITKVPSLYVDETVNGEGKAKKVCTVCGDETDEYVLPAITLDQLNGGILTNDMIESFVEERDKLDENGDPILDDDGNAFLVSTHVNSKPEHLFDGNHGVSHMWTTNGNFWYIGKGGKLTVTLKEKVLVSYVKLLATTNWTTMDITFYDGTTEVAKMVKGPNGDAFGTADAKWYDLTEYLGITGKYIDKIVFEKTFEKAVNYEKFGELEIGIHEHVYSEADIKANGTHGTGENVCKWTHTATCLECHAKAKDAVAYFHDIETETIREASCGNGIYTDTCKAEGCKYTKENYTVAGTGEHDYSTYVVQAKRANCGAEGTAYFTCATCKEREVIPNVTFKESESEKAQEALLAIVANLTGKKLAQDVVADGITIAKKFVDKDKNFFTEEQAMMAVQSGVTEFYFSSTDAQTGEAVTIKYTIAISGSYNAEKPEDSTYTISVKVGEATKGLHTMGTKNIVPSTYTVHGEDYAYCTKCGVEFKDIRSEAALKAIGTGVYVRDNGFSLRTSDYEGIRLTMTVNKDNINKLFAGYSVRIWVIATNSAGESSEIQVYGAGAKNLISNNGKFSVVVKDFAHDRENIKFQLKISVKDANGEQVEYRDIGTTSLAKVREAGV